MKIRFAGTKKGNAWTKTLLSCSSRKTRHSFCARIWLNSFFRSKDDCITAPNLLFRRIIEILLVCCKFWFISLVSSNIKKSLSKYLHIAGKRDCKLNVIHYVETALPAFIPVSEFFHNERKITLIYYQKAKILYFWCISLYIPQINRNLWSFLSFLSSFLF